MRRPPPEGANRKARLRRGWPKGARQSIGPEPIFRWQPNRMWATLLKVQRPPKGQGVAAPSVTLELKEHCEPPNAIAKVRSSMRSDQGRCAFAAHLRYAPWVLFGAQALSTRACPPKLLRKPCALQEKRMTWPRKVEFRRTGWVRGAHTIRRQVCAACPNLVTSAPLTGRPRSQPSANALGTQPRQISLK